MTHQYPPHTKVWWTISALRNIILFKIFYIRSENIPPASSSRKQQERPYVLGWMLRLVWSQNILEPNSSKNWLRVCKKTFYKYIQTFVHVKFVCTNIFRHSTFVRHCVREAYPYQKHSFFNIVQKAVDTPPLVLDIMLHIFFWWISSIVRKRLSRQNLTK